MRGHAPVLAMRQRGALVPSATLADYPLPAHIWRDWPTFAARAEIEIEPGDNPLTIDLRYLVGVPVVWVEGFDRERLDVLCAAAFAAGAARVIGVHLRQATRPFDDPDVIAMTDSEGALTWPN